MDLDIKEIEIQNPSKDIDQEQLSSLAESIKEKGLSHPIIVRRMNNKILLVSGEKRLLAYRMLGLETIPAVERVFADDDEAREIRVHENIKRFNLEWWEEAELVRELHEIRQKKHGIPVAGRPVRDQEKAGWSIRDTARELDKALGGVAEDLLLARSVELDPSLKRVKDRKTAVKLARLAAQRQEAELEAGAPSNIQLEVDNVYMGDSASILSKFPTCSIDHCVTDPPWIKFFDKTLTIDNRTLPVFKELYRVLKINAFAYIICGLDDYHYYCGHDIPSPDTDVPIHVAGTLEKIGFKISKTPIIWHKEKSLSRRGVASWEYDRDFEFIIVAVKGSPALTSGRRVSSIKSFPVVPVAHLIHPNEKPSSLIKDILDDCSYENQVIVDPFAGSGVLAEACIESKRHYVLIERDKKSHDEIIKRIGEVNAGPRT